LTSPIRNRLISIDSQLDGIVRAARRTAFVRHGGLAGGIVAHRKLIAEQGPRRAAELTQRFSVLNQAASRLYAFRPSLAAEHMAVCRRLLDAGAFQPPYGFRRWWMRGWLVLEGGLARASIPARRIRRRRWRLGHWGKL